MKLSKGDHQNSQAMNCKWFAVCPMKFYWEQGKLDTSWIDNYCKGKWSRCIRYEKEEKGIDHPDNMLPNGKIDASLPIHSDHSSKSTF